MKIYKVIDALEQFAPLPLQEDYDNAGLQIGLTEAEVSGALLCLDVTPQIVEEAIRKGCNLIVSHHPLIFRKLKRIADENEVQKTVRLAIENHVAIVSMHTNLDAAIGGVNSKIAEKIGLQNTQFLGKQQNIDGVCAGEGVIGELSEELAADDLVIMLKKVFITGEMSYHEFFGHNQDIQICVIGHYQSEQFTPEIFKSVLDKHCPEVKTFIAETNTNPILYL